MKIYFKLPAPAQLSAFLHAEQAADFTYAFVGSTAETRPGGPPGFDHDRQRAAIGAGPADFERAKQALRAWAHFPPAWTKILPEQTPLQPGATLAMFFRLGGFWWRNSCRVVYARDEPARFGFAYGTLPGHLECGEELFQVELDATTGTVWYELRAFSRPRHPLARSGYPLVRLLQEKFRQDSALAMRRYVRGEGAAEPVFTPDAWLLRGGLFVLAALWLWPGSLFGHDYGKLPLAFAMLLIVPAGLLLAGRHFPAARPLLMRVQPWLLPAALPAVVALGLPPGLVSGALALPWLAVCSWVAWTGVRLVVGSDPSPNPSPEGEGSVPSVGAAPLPFRGGVGGGVAKKGVGAGMVYLLIGAAWFFAERAGLRPFGFGDDIVRLTALHFHYAGFALPLLAGLAARFLPNRFAAVAVWAVVLGVPFTALGITATQEGLGPFLETFAAVFMAFAGLLAAAVWLTLGLRRRNEFLIAAGAALGCGMALALTYGLRAVFPELALSLDWMRALHGSLNGFVAAPLGFLGFWYLR